MPEREPKRSMAAIVAQEMERPDALAKMFMDMGDPPETARLRAYLNNFSANIPDSNGASMYQRQMVKYGRFEGLPMAELHEKKFYAGMSTEEKEAEVRERGATLKKLESTEGEFMADVRAAIKKAGVDQAELTRLVEDDQRRMNDMEAWKTLLLPVYIELRKMGYSERDLTA